LTVRFGKVLHNFRERYHFSFLTTKKIQTRPPYSLAQPAPSSPVTLGVETSFLKDSQTASTAASLSTATSATAAARTFSYNRSWDPHGSTLTTTKLSEKNNSQTLPMFLPTNVYQSLKSRYQPPMDIDTYMTAYLSRQHRH
jgi:hypothetical protein